MLRYVFCFVLMNLPTWAVAQIGGGSTYSFLNLTPSPRVSALAQASLAGTDGDIQFTWWNPALLREEHRRQIGLSYVALPGGINAGEAAYAFGLGEKQHAMVGFRYIDYGEFAGTEIDGSPTGTFGAADQLLNFGYAYHLDSNWQFGGNFKLINSVYESYTSFGTALDLAAIYQIPDKRLAMALVARNIGAQLTTYAGERESLPFEIQFAISNRFEHLPFRWTVQLENLQRWDLTYFDPNAVTRDPVTGDEVYEEPDFGVKLLRHLAVSGDLILGKRINAQVGYSFRRAGEMSVPTRRTSAGLTFGVGIRLSKFHLNYGNRYVHVAGRMHHMGVTVDLEDFGS